MDADKHRLIKNVKKIHMVGICGVGVAGLAYLLKERGYEVSGCDLQENELTGWLEDNGIKVSIGHDAGHIGKDVDLVIRSRAVPDDCADIIEAEDRNIPVLFRGEVLPLLLEDSFSVAVSGTHGKTTTTAFIVQVLRSAGRDPSWFVGAECDALSGIAGISTNQPINQSTNLLIVEADESDGTVGLYEPDIAVITNVDFDHMEHFKDEEEFRDCFRKFVGNARDRVIYCGDDCPVKAEDIRDEENGQRFLVVADGENMGEVFIPVPGRHNVLNALAACAVCLALGVDFDDIRVGLASVELPCRRFERVVDREGVMVISDYAHHPSEIRELVAAAGVFDCKRIRAVFQPHRYTRTLALGDDFPLAFEGIDELVLCPVYAASESQLRGGMAWDLYERFKVQGSSFKVCLAQGLEEAWEYFRRDLKEGDILLVIGAGDVHKLAEMAACEVDSGQWTVDSGSARSNTPALQCSNITCTQPLAGKTAWGVGGCADIWVDVGSEGDLVELLKWAHEQGLPFNILGAGSNVLVGDLGVRGVVARLSGGEFRKIALADPTLQHSNTPTEVIVGAGAPGAKLLDWIENEGLGRLDFLEGIPGMLGGMLKMNAGAAGHEICEAVLWIRCLKRDGSVVKLGREELNWGYRCCDTLCDLIVLEAGLGVGAPQQGLRKELAAKRQWMKGLRCAGSVFKNPGKAAGALIDEAGLKGRKVGGARVYEEHANFIVTEKGATASDVMALVGIVKAEVLDRFGVTLEEEIKYI